MAPRRPDQGRVRHGAARDPTDQGGALSDAGQDRWGRLIAVQNASSFSRGSSAGCRVVFAVGMRRRMMELRGRSLQMWTPHSAGTAGAPHQAEWLCPRPGRDVSVRSASARYRLCRSGRCSGGAVKHLAGSQHRVHRDRKLAGDGDSGAFEAEPLFESEPPGSQPAFG